MTTEDKKRAALEWLENDLIGELVYFDDAALAINTIRELLQPAPVDAEVMEDLAMDAIKRIDKHTPTYEGSYDDFYIVMRSIRAATKKTPDWYDTVDKNLTVIEKNMGDAVTREDTADHAASVQASPATSCKSCDSIFGGREYLIERINVLEKSCEGLLKALESLMNACYKAAAHEELSEFIDRSLLHSAEKALAEHRKNMGVG